MSPAGWEYLFNTICLGIAVLIGGFTVFMYRLFQPKFYGLLLWAFFLTLCAALTYGIYTSLLDAFLGMKTIDKEVVLVKSRLADNMRLLAFVVPGLMLGVAVNLITAFIQAPNPRSK